MSKRRVTPTEFKYIKELLAKHKSKAKVARMTARSRSLMFYVNKATDFKNYCDIRPGSNWGKEKVKNGEKKQVPVSKEPSQPTPVKIGMSEESMRILTELQNVRKATFAVCGELKKFKSPQIIVQSAPCVPVPEQLSLKNNREEKTNTLTSLVLIVIGIIVLAMSIFRL